MDHERLAYASYRSVVFEALQAPQNFYTRRHRCVITVQDPTSMFQAGMSNGINPTASVWVRPIDLVPGFKLERWLIICL